MNEARNARAINHVNIPFGSTKTFSDTFGVCVLENGQTRARCEIGKAVLESREVDDHDLCTAQRGGVVVDEILELRNLRMTMRSGGLREVHDKHGPKELISTAILTVGR
jgi:hypothetical protein